MRLSRALHAVMMLGFISSLMTFCLWTSCGGNGEIQARDSHLQVYRRMESIKEPSFVKTQFHGRGTNSIDGNEEGEENGDDNDEDENGEWEEVEELVKDIPCLINGNFTIPCKREKEETFMPWSFIKNYFEVFGEMKNGTFDFHHANSIVHPPQPTYGPGAMFMAFDHYTVEQRSRVKCITASEGVPITTQWSKQGYHYPIQVSQYGLSHHAKYLLNGEPEKRVLENGEGKTSNWMMPDRKSEIKRVKDQETGERVMEFWTTDSLQTKGIQLPISEKNLRCLSVDLKFSTNGSLVVIGELGEGERVRIYFVFTQNWISFDPKTASIYYGLGDRTNEWIHLAREFKFDIMKGFLTKFKQDKANKLWFRRILEVRIHGHGWLDNLTLSKDVHLDQFFASANWLVRHQDQRGGWPIMVPRVLIPGVLELQPGWYSAMGQGQAMSTLTRAYTLTGDETYLDAAVRGLKLFDVPSERGGIRARFLGKLDWYEEYPTIPSLFVLNGFIYSLLGLYDLKLVARGEGKETATRVYDSGMFSLKTIIGLYDSGAGTFYDLRHVTTGIQPNRARWDYHTTHINQILQLIVIDDSPIFKTTVQRWLGYLQGRRSRHN